MKVDHHSPFLGKVRSDLIGGSLVLKAKGEGPDDPALAEERHHHQSLEARREADDLMKEGELREEVRGPRDEGKDEVGGC